MANLIIWNTMNTPSPFHRVGRPSGPHILAQWLIQFGFTVKVIDFCSNISTDDLVAITRKHIDSSTVAIGVSSTFWEDNARYIGRKDINLIATSFRRSEVDPPDWVVSARTQLEPSFPKLDWILGGANSEAPLTSTWLRFHQNPEDQIRRYLDERLALSRTHVPFSILMNTGAYMDNLRIRPDEALGLEWGRGCQFRCRFCRYKNIGKAKNTYLRNPDIIRQDMILNYEKYGTTRYIYMDDTTNESIEKVESMVRVAQSLPFTVEWVGYGRLDLMGTNKPTIDLLRDSGVRSMMFGVESFNREASKIVGKGWNGVHGKDFLLELKQRWGDEANFHISFIAGLSPETPEELDATLEWCIQNNMASWQFIPLGVTSVPLLDSSEFDRRAVEFGYSFPTSSPNYWENGPWNYKLAFAKAAELNQKTRFRCKPSAFLLADIAGMTKESLKDTMAHFPLTEEVNTLVEEILIDYVSYQLSIDH